MMKPCFNTITAGKDKPLEEIIDACKAVGFAGIEIDLSHAEAASDRTSLTEIRKRLTDANVDLASLMAFDLAPLAEDGKAVDRFKRGVDVAHELGAPLLLVYCATNVPNGMSPDQAGTKASKRAAEYAALAGDIIIGLEPIGRTTLMGRPEDGVAIAKEVHAPNVGVVLDTFHLHLAGVTDIRTFPVEALSLFHVNDSEDLPIEQLKDSNRIHVGQGILPLETYLSTLAEKGYDGFLSVEIFRPEYWRQPVTQVVQEAKQSLDLLLRKIGGKANQ
jgi:2-keto-myo-inositol isomerase